MAKQEGIKPAQSTEQKAVAPKPQVTDEQKKALALLKALPSQPPLLSGGTSTNWAQDFSPISAISVERNGAWIKVFSHDGSSAKLDQSQQLALMFATAAMVSSPRTDRGGGYQKWLYEARETVKKTLGAYQLKVEFTNSAMSTMVFTVQQALAVVSITAPVIDASLKLAPATRRKRGKGEKSEDKYEIDLIL